MKTFIQAAGLFLIMVLTFLALAGLFSESASETELENTLDNALEHALYVAMSGDKVYTISNQEELAADVMHELFATSNVKADYDIAFHVIDLQNGLIDVQVTQTVKTSPFIKTEVVCRKTVILDSAADSAA